MILHSPEQLIHQPERIISLVPSQTELLFHLGLEASVAGITKFCIHPGEWLSEKIIVGGTKNINVQKIKKCGPDLIIANKEENVKEQIEALAQLYNVWVTDVSNLDDSLNMIKQIGAITQTITRAHEIAALIRYQFSNIHVLPKKIAAAYLIWRNPCMTIGGDTFIHDMLTWCGFENVFALQKRYPVVEIKELQNAGIELLLLSSEPYPFKQQHIDELQLQLPQTKIVLVDGEMFSWYGSRLLQAPEYFNRLIKSIEVV